MTTLEAGASASYLIDKDISTSTMGIAFGTPVIEHTTCGYDNGRIELTTNGATNDYKLYMDGMEISSLIVEDLHSGVYQFRIVDNDNNQDFLIIEIEDSEVIGVKEWQFKPTTCDRANGFLYIRKLYGTPTHFSLDGGPFTEEREFENLAARTYTLVSTNWECYDTIIVEVKPSIPPKLVIENITNASCDNPLGSVQLRTENGRPDFTYSLRNLSNNRSNSINTGLFENLEPGAYRAFVRDTDYCTDSIDVNISLPGVNLTAQVDKQGCEDYSTVVLSATGGSGVYEFADENSVYGSITEFNDLASGSYTFYVRSSDGCADTLVQLIDNAAKPELTVSDITAATCGEDNGSFAWQAIGGAGDVIVTLLGDTIVENQIANLAAGNYTLKVEDEYCLDSVLISIAALSSPSLILQNIEDLSCSNSLGSVTLSTTGAYGNVEYALRDQSNSYIRNDSGIFQDLLSGTYQAYIVDENSCQDSLEFVLSDVNKITLSADIDLGECEDFAMISLSAEGGDGNYEFAGDDGIYGNITEYTNLSSGTYTFYVRGTDACPDTLVQIIEIGESSDLVITEINDATCGQDNGSIKWDLVGNQGDITVTILGEKMPANEATDLAPGDYLVYFGAGSCLDSVSVSIAGTTAPSLSIENLVDLSCNQDFGSIQLKAEEGDLNYLYSLSTNGSLIASNSIGLFETLETGVYRAYVNDGSGCTDSLDFELSEVNRVELDAELIEGTCGNPATVILAAQGGDGNYEYASDNQAYGRTNEFTGLEEGLNTFYVRDLSGCSDTITQDVTYQELPQIIISEITNARCGENNGSLSWNIVGGHGELEVTLQGNSLDDNFAYDLAPGEYELMVMDENGCMDFSSVEIIGSPDLEITDVIVREVSCNKGSGSFYLEYIGGSGNIETIITNSVTGEQMGSSQNLPLGLYDLMIKDEFGCYAEDTVELISDECILYVPNIFSPLLQAPNNKFVVYPNQYSQIESLSMTIHDKWGNQVFYHDAIDPYTFNDWWDGLHMGKQAEKGMYSYVVIAKTNGDDIKLTGAVMLIR